MKKLLSISGIFCIILCSAQAQWKLTGNAGTISGSNVSGTAYNHIVPEADSNRKELIYASRYVYAEPLLVKAVQQLSTQNEALITSNATLQLQLQNLQSQIDKMKAIIESLAECSPCNTAGYPKRITGPEQGNNMQLFNMALEQNTPNPFSSGTTIRYTLPQQYSSAKIVISDNSGKLFKAINLSGSGKGSVRLDASSLAGGTYRYSLYINNNLVETKQMLISR